MTGFIMQYSKTTDDIEEIRKRGTAKADPGSMLPEELEQYVAEKGWKRFRAGQIFSWIHRKGVSGPEEMTNIPAEIRQELEQDYVHVREETRRVSLKDGTVKYLFRMDDGQMIETVFMPYQKGCSVCISSQAGCPMGCRFCASAIGGWKRNLTASEMLGQVYAASRLSGRRPTDIVVMGTGEPMDNLDNLLRFFRLISAEEGMHFSLRSITVSTCGIVPGIRKLADSGFPVTLALSLHAPADALRKTIMPVANRYTISETLEACRYYFRKTGRRITVEYSLMHGINDGTENARLLGTLLTGSGFHVNLIPVNPVTERDFQRGTTRDTEAFKNALEKYHINVTIRKSMGSDIDAACGQLRRKYGDSH